MTSSSRHSVPCHRQRGAALLVGLIFLLVLTLMGVSSMSTARLEQKMVANTQFSDWAFQAAESGIQATLTEDDIFVTETPDSNSDGIPDGISHSYGSTSTNTRYVGSGMVPIGGFSLDAGMAAHHYQLVSSAQAASGAESVHRQGFFKVGPG